METNMKTFTFAAAALLLASTAAHAGNSISFEIDGHKVHIEAPRDCDSLSCLKISAPGLSGSGFNLKGLTSKLNDDDDVADNAPPPAPKAPPVPAPAAQATAPQVPAPAPVASNPPPAPPSVVASAPAAPAAAPVAATAPAPQPTPVAAPTTPVGVWQTKDNKGNVRIEQCGTNLCGYADKTNERILINMKPQDDKWVGRIHDPEGGSTYDSTIAMKGPNALKVQGCALGGLFCGGQTWKRVS
jgi:uncharacterized protein (DUF2147 family)